MHLLMSGSPGDDPHRSLATPRADTDLREARVTRGEQRGMPAVKPPHGEGRCGIPRRIEEDGHQAVGASVRRQPGGRQTELSGDRGANRIPRKGFAFDRRGGHRLLGQQLGLGLRRLGHAERGDLGKELPLALAALPEQWQQDAGVPAERGPIRALPDVGRHNGTNCITS